MTSKFCNLALTASLIVSATSLLAQELKTVPTSDNPGWNDYVRLTQSSALDLSGDESYELKIEYTLHDLDGKPQKSGIAEQTFDPVGHHHTHIHYDSLEWDSSAVGDEYRRQSGRESYLVLKALELIVHPVAARVQSGIFKSLYTTLDSHEGTMRCVQFRATDMHVSGGVGPEYCVDTLGSPRVVRANILSEGTRSDFKRYGDWNVPQVIELRLDERTAITAHLVDISALRDVQPPKDSVGSTARLSPEVAAGLRIGGKPPSFPKAMLLAHKSGHMILCGIIDPEGKLVSLDVVASPDKSFTKSALDAVKTWEYRPYIVNGVAKDVDTAITVNYNLNR